MSVLLPATLAILRTVPRKTAPVFSNMIAAELFEAEHTRGRFKLLPFRGEGGGYVVFDTKAPLNRGVVSWHAGLAEAHGALEAAAKVA